MNAKRIILGIAPGTQLLRFGIICVEGKKAAYSKLQTIYECIGEVCRNNQPTELAIESPFYGKNAQVVLKPGRAQGAAILAAKEYGVESVTEYAPPQGQGSNGSSLALPRVVAALLEDNQKDGYIEIPECLRPYTGFDHID